MTDSRPCMHRGQQPLARSCRVCELFETSREHRQLWGGPPPAGEKRRSLPCIFLGEVLDRRGCPCPGKWLRACALHGPILIEQCKTCGDYEAEP
jgi:hypothetical protein